MDLLRSCLPQENLKMIIPIANVYFHFTGVLNDTAFPKKHFGFHIQRRRTREKSWLGDFLASHLAALTLGFLPFGMEWQ